MDEDVERLRNRAVCSAAHNSCRNDFACEKAADTIEALRAENAKLREALKPLVEAKTANVYGQESGMYFIDVAAMRAARAAMGESDE